jgi:hypothetical protein
MLSIDHIVRIKIKKCIKSIKKIPSYKFYSNFGRLYQQIMGTIIRNTNEIKTILSFKKLSRSQNERKQRPNR